MHTTCVTLTWGSGTSFVYWWTESLIWRWGCDGKGRGQGDKAMSECRNRIQGGRMILQKSLVGSFYKINCYSVSGWIDLWVKWVGGFRGQSVKLWTNGFQTSLQVRWGRSNGLVCIQCSLVPKGHSMYPRLITRRWGLWWWRQGSQD